RCCAIRLRRSRYVSLWKLTQHPAYAWEVIGICTEHGSPLPPEITDYLGGVANRMDGARQEGDLRKVLSMVIGFPAKKKNGPGKPFDPDACDPDDIDLAILFATELESGLSVPKALKNATANPSLPVHFATLDERSLKKRIAKAVGLEVIPSTAAEWRTELHSCIAAFLDLLHRLRHLAH